MIPVITATPKRLKAEIKNEFRFMTPSYTRNRKLLNDPSRIAETLPQLSLFMLCLFPIHVGAICDWTAQNGNRINSVSAADRTR